MGCGFRAARNRSGFGFGFGFGFGSGFDFGSGLLFGFGFWFGFGGCEIPRWFSRRDSPVVLSTCRAGLFRTGSPG
jgi:hypothetical protein